jgi:hypothetical protein
MLIEPFCLMTIPDQVNEKQLGGGGFSRSRKPVDEYQVGIDHFLLFWPSKFDDRLPIAWQNSDLLAFHDNARSPNFDALSEAVRLGRFPGELW